MARLKEIRTSNPDVKKLQTETKRVVRQLSREIGAVDTSSDTPGPQGPQGIYRFNIYRYVTHGNAAPAAPTGGSVSNGVLTAPTGWSETFPSAQVQDAANFDVYESFASYNPDGNSLGAWATPFKIDVEAGPTGPEGPKGDKGEKGDKGDAPTTGTARGRLVGRTTALPTTAVARTSPNLTNISPGSGTNYTYWWTNILFSAGYDAQRDNIIRNVLTPTSFFPVDNPTTPDMIGFQLVTKVGTVEKQSVNLFIGPSPLTREDNTYRGDRSEIILWFNGGPFSRPPHTGSPSRLIFSYLTTQDGYSEMSLWGDGTALPANSTIEIYELVVRGGKGDKGDTGATGPVTPNTVIDGRVNTLVEDIALKSVTRTSPNFKFTDYWKGTQAQFDALTSAQKTADIYIFTD